MTSVLAYVSLALIGLGLLFSSLAVVGLIRLPDVFTRAHATSKTDTLGAVLTLAGVAVAFETNVPRVKLVLLALFLLITNPTATHAITRAAQDQGIEPWTTDEERDET
ncbi:monovalent cation/H(+) antiporter subunit G [Salinibaculum rarum]|uniref:monovalent cation/H(+) antiporter subunit G n=1 Tax=Salinibaculum rarum TaxID=3058903 RepID=UPI00265EC467|nr:monovalent cation/H(+) antiporter subunit G [Salinibaculum sp. KK48]